MDANSRGPLDYQAPSSHTAGESGSDNPYAVVYSVPARMSAPAPHAGPSVGSPASHHSATLGDEAGEQSQRLRELNTRLQRALVESNHRIKNQLQTVAALVDLELARSGDTVPADELRRLTRHIRAMATVHDLLTLQARASDGSEALLVPVRPVIHQLVRLLERQLGTRHIECTIADLHVTMRQGSAVVLLLNEVASNAIKHADGPLHIALSVVDESVACLEVIDEGPGLPPGLDPLSPTTTGLELVNTLASLDLQGRVAYAASPLGGLRITVTFPLAAHNG